MKKRHELLGEGIAGVGLVILVVVAALAGQREIIESCETPLTARENVVQREQLSGVLGGTPTIFTASPGASFDSSSKGNAIKRRHRRV
jgi:hypothetical protein